jgi:uncharacterized DUF497 family protein
MTIEWDSTKAQSNRKKHGISFPDAAEVLYDEFAITIEDTSSSEQRHVTIGQDALGRILVIVYTWRGDKIRLISARKATARERAQYEERR